MLLFMVAQLPGLIPHKLWASPHESTTTNHPTLRLRDLSSLEKGLPFLDKNASPRQDAPAPGMIPTRVAAAECPPSPTSFRLSCQQDHAGDSRSPTAPASCFEYWTQSRFLHHWVTSRSIPHFGFWMVFLGQSVPGFRPPPPVASSFGNHCPPSPSTSSIEHWFPYSVLFWSCIPCLKTCPLHNSLRLHHLRILRYLSNSRVGGLR